MPRFSIKDLIVSTTLVAAGFAAALSPFRFNFEVDGRAIWPLLLSLWFGGCMMVGAGAMYPFKRAWIGALLGFLVALIGLLPLWVVGH